MEDRLQALAQAAQRDDVKTVEQLVDPRDPQGILRTRMPFASLGTILHVCVQWGSLTTLDTLVGNYGHEHFDVCIRDIEGDTALHNLANWRSPRASAIKDGKMVASLLLKVLDHGTISANELLAVQNSHGDLTALCKALAYKRPIMSKAILDAAKGNLEETTRSIESVVTSNNVAPDSHWLAIRARGWRIADAYSLGDRGYDHKTTSYMNDPFCTALHLAVLGEYDEIVSRIIEYPDAPCLTNLQDHDGNTPLHVAAKVGHLGICTSLLKYDMSRYDMEYMAGRRHYQRSVVAKNNKGETPLHIASTFGHAEVCERLLEYGASVSTQDDRGRYAVTNAHFRYAEDNASAKGDDEAVKKLLDACIPTSSGGEITGGTSDQHSSHNPNPRERLINEPFAFGFTPLHVAVATSSQYHIESLLAAGAMRQSVSRFGRTPLHVAANIHNPISLTKLLHAPGNWINKEEKKKWINAKDDKGQTALHKVLQIPSSRHSSTVAHDPGETIQAGRISSAATPERVETINEMVVELLREEAWVDVQDFRGETPLHAAVRLNDHIVVQTLLDAVVDNFRRGERHDRGKWISMCDFSGETALHVAAKEGNAGSVCLLLHGTTSAGVLARIRDMENKTALDWAAIKGDVNTINALISTFKFNDEITLDFLVWHLGEHLLPQDHASFCGEYDVTENPTRLLLQKAVSMRDVDIARELINRGADVTVLDHDDRRWLAQTLGKISSDIPTLQDGLGRKELVQGVATLLLNAYTQTPVTIGIFGSWGAGKSSFMLQVETAMLCMVVKETFKKTNLSPPTEQSASVTEFSRPGARLRSFVVKALNQRMGKLSRADAQNTVITVKNWGEAFKEDDIITTFPTELLQNDCQFFKSLALTDRSKLVQSHGGAQYEKRSTQTFREAQHIAYMPSLLTLHYNAWKYNDKNKASAGLAVGISEQLESFMTPDQWLRMCFKHSWKRYSHKIFLHIFYPILLSIVLFSVVFVVWEFTDISTKGKSLSLGATILTLALGFFRALVQVIQPVTQSLLEKKSFMDHESMLGYQHQVIEDINFLKSELCEEAHVGWKFLGILLFPFFSKSYNMEGTGIRKQHPLPNNFRIVVFIDDLDRCDEKTILEVLRAVHLILGSCNINVVIGVDKDMVHRAINKEFSHDVGRKSSDEGFESKRWLQKRDGAVVDRSKILFAEYDKSSVDTHELAEKYLQKIIHLPIQLPDPSRKDLKKFLQKQVGKREKPRRTEQLGSKVWSATRSLEISGQQFRFHGEIYPSMDREDREDEFEEHGVDNREIEEHRVDNREDPMIFKLLLATYTPNEREMLDKLCQLATDEKRGPREWKRYLNYHRLVWTILSQDESMKEPHFKGWQRKLFLWIFICWNWRDQMDEIFKNWNVLISDVFKRREQSILQGKAKVDEEELPQLLSMVDDEEEPRLLNIVDEYTARKEESLRENGRQKDEVISKPWVDLAATLKEEYGIQLHFIEKFQHFRFYCVFNHLEIGEHLRRKEG